MKLDYLYSDLIKRQMILPKNTFCVIPLPDENQQQEAIPVQTDSQVTSWEYFDYIPDQSKYFGVAASVFDSHLVS